jgi:hypothetical protein
MATLAAFFRKTEAPAVSAGCENWASEQECRLRPLPAEDVYFFIKKIDNSRVVREADPAARRRAWKAGVKGFAAAGLLIMLLVPKALDVVTGYRVHMLAREHETLVNAKAVVELEEAQLRSPDRLEQLARELRLVNPDPKRVVVLNAKTDSALAMNNAAR